MPIITKIIALLLVSLPGNLHAEWQELPLVDLQGRLFAASTTLNGPQDNNGLGKYGPHNLFDHNPATCWAEGIVGNGIGEVLYMDIAYGQREIFINNGYTKSRDLFKKNNRVKTLGVSLLIGVNPPGFATDRTLLYHTLPLDHGISLALEDSMAAQQRSLDFDWQSIRASQQDVLNQLAARFTTLKIPYSRNDLVPTYILRLEIRDVYQGGKYTDTCLSEISFVEHPLKISVSEREDAILVDTDLGRQRILVKESDSVFLLLDQTEDNMWFIAHKMPRHGVGVSVEVEEILFNVALGRRVDSTLLGAKYPQFYGFKDGQLQYSTGALEPDTQISLTRLQQMMLGE